MTAVQRHHRDDERTAVIERRADKVNSTTSPVVPQHDRGEQVECGQDVAPTQLAANALRFARCSGCVDDDIAGDGAVDEGAGLPRGEFDERLEAGEIVDGQAAFVAEFGRVRRDGRGRTKARLGHQQIGLRVFEDVRHFAVGEVKVHRHEVQPALDAGEVRHYELDAIRQHHGDHATL